MSPDNLQWFVQVLPGESSAQNRMMVHDSLPCSLERRHIQVLQYTSHLRDVEASFRIVETVKKHSLLRWREWVGIFNICGSTHSCNPAGLCLKGGNCTWSGSVPLRN